LSSLETEVALGLVVLGLALLMLPWAGGLILTLVNFWYANTVIRSQNERITQLHTENDLLRTRRNELQQENYKLSNSLQATMMENAMLSARLDDGTDD
jgi:cell division protein FtsB